jgi:hypothetical protein
MVDQAALPWQPLRDVTVNGGNGASHRECDL